MRKNNGCPRQYVSIVYECLIEFPTGIRYEKSIAKNKFLHRNNENNSLISYNFNKSNITFYNINKIVKIKNFKNIVVSYFIITSNFWITSFMIK